MVVVQGRLRENALNVLSFKSIFIRPWQLAIQSEELLYVTEVVKYIAENLSLHKG